MTRTRLPSAWRRASLVAVLPLALVLLDACTSQAPEPPTLTFSFQRSSSSMTFLTRNASSDLAMLYTCGNRLTVAVDRYSAGRWINGDAEPCVFSSVMVPLPLGSGEAKLDSIALPTPGRYRVRLMLRRNSWSAPTEVIASQGFTVD